MGTAAKGAGAWGQMDLSGNVSEWVLDAYDDYVTPCVDCANTERATTRAVRGGVYFLGAGSLPPPVRFDTEPTTDAANFGVRCARPL